MKIPRLHPSFLTRPRPRPHRLSLHFSSSVGLESDLIGHTVTEKHTTVVQRGKQYWVGLSDMQGWRISASSSNSSNVVLLTLINLMQAWKTLIQSIYISPLLQIKHPHIPLLPRLPNLSQNSPPGQPLPTNIPQNKLEMPSWVFLTDMVVQQSQNTRGQLCILD